MRARYSGVRRTYVQTYIYVLQGKNLRESISSRTLATTEGEGEGETRIDEAAELETAPLLYPIQSNLHGNSLARYVFVSQQYQGSIEPGSVE